MNQELEINIHTLLYIRLITSMTYCVAQGTLLNILITHMRKESEKVCSSSEFLGFQKYLSNHWSLAVLEYNRFLK